MARAIRNRYSGPARSAASALGAASARGLSEARAAAAGRTCADGGVPQCGAGGQNRRGQRHSAPVGGADRKVRLRSAANRSLVWPERLTVQTVLDRSVLFAADVGCQPRIDGIAGRAV